MVPHTHGLFNFAICLIRAAVCIFSLTYRWEIDVEKEGKLLLSINVSQPNCMFSIKTVADLKGGFQYYRRRKHEKSVGWGELKFKESGCKAAQHV